MKRSLSRFLLAALLLVALGAPGCGAWKRFQYEGFDRDSWQKPDDVIALLGIDPGDHVADIGAGGGYFTFRFAEATGPGGRVYAVDVDDDMVAYLEERVAEQHLSHVLVVRGDFDDPKLPDHSIDLVFLANTYHHIENRPDYFRRILVDLAPKGRVALVELDERSGFAHTIGHASDADEVIAEMAEAGYRLEARHGNLERQSFLVFEPDDQTGE